MSVPADYHTLAAAAQDGLAEMQKAATELGAKTLTHRSEDGAVAAVVSLHGRMIELTVRHDAVRGYDSESLGELIAATIRAGQAEARETYEAEVRLATPPAVGRYLDLIRDACDM